MANVQGKWSSRTPKHQVACGQVARTVQMLIPGTKITTGKLFHLVVKVIFVCGFPDGHPHVEGGLLGRWLPSG